MPPRTSTWRRFALCNLEATPWRNGGGLTRQIANGVMNVRAARSCALEGEEWDWRVSVADIQHPGPFSLFPGTERHAALAAGDALELRATDTSLPALRFETLGAMHRFSGATALASTLPSGPAQLFNVMTRQGHAHAQVRAIRLDTRFEASSNCALVLLCVRGAFRPITDDTSDSEDLADPLRAGDGMTLLHGRRATLQLKVLAPDSCLLAARIETC